MLLSDVSIRRPVFATMVIAAIVVFGVVLYSRLTVDLYPNVNFPVVTATVVYPGASPETMEKLVAEPMEEALNSLSGIRSLRSASLEGVAQVILEFDLKVDAGKAAQETRDRLASIQSQSRVPFSRDTKKATTKAFADSRSPDSRSQSPLDHPAGIFVWACGEE